MHADQTQGTLWNWSYYKVAPLRNYTPNLEDVRGGGGEDRAVLIITLVNN